MRRLFCLSSLSVCLGVMSFRAAYSAMAFRNHDQEDPVEVAIRKATTIGQLERLAGIETNKDRAEFWLAFAPLRNRALKAGKAELKRIIRNKRGGKISR